MSFLDLIELGGSLMIPLIILSLIMFAFIFDSIIIVIFSFINLKKVKNGEEIKSSFDPISRFMKISNISNLTKKDILSFELNKFERKVNFLSTIATISPLVGLLGTVFGMMKIFNVVSKEKPTNPIAMLSEGISEALFATAGGLIIAIISGFSYYFFISLIDYLEEEVLRSVEV